MLTYAEALELCPEVGARDRLSRARIEHLEALIEWFKTAVFGKRSEIRALKNLSIADQLWLGMELLPVPEEPPPKTTTVREHERQQRKKPTTPKPDDASIRFGPEVPVKVIEREDPSAADIPPEQRELIGVEVVRKLAQQSSYLVLEYRTKKYKNKETGEISAPTAPPSVIPGSIADVSFLAGILVDKFLHHLPLYRLHERLLHAGITVSRGNLTRLVHRLAELLEPIYDALRSSVLLSPIVAADESPTPAGRRQGVKNQPGKMRQGYFWAFYGCRQELFFHFSPSRSRVVLDDLLKDFTGVLLTDGYAAYESFIEGRTQITHAQCWTHSRRNFIQAGQIAPQQTEQVLKAIQQLYLVEKEAPLGSEELGKLRQRKSAQIVDALFSYLDKQVAESVFLPSNAFHKAAQYVLNRREPLSAFLDNPNIPLDTNHVERSIRPTVIGRKNWLFNFTETGARSAAIFYSLLQSCVAAGVHPTTYLIDVLQRIDTHPAQKVALLTPRLWKEHFAANPLRSPATEPD